MSAEILNPQTQSPNEPDITKSGDNVKTEDKKTSILALGYSVDEPEQSTEPQKKEKETDSEKFPDQKKKDPVHKEQGEDTKTFNPFESESQGKDKNQDSDSDYKSRFESTRSEYLKAARQLSHAKKTIRELAQEQEWDEEVSQKVLSSLDFKPSEKISFGSDSEEQPFIMKVVDVVNQELPTFKKYNTSPDVDKFLSAFERWYVSDSSAEDKEMAHKALKGLVDDPAQLIQKMTQVGENLYKKIYASVEQAGGLFSFMENHAQALSEKDKTIERLTTQLDNLKKKKNNEEDYIASTGLKIDSGKSNRGTSSSNLMSAW